MPKGNNELRINAATLCEAVQFWLDRAILKDGANMRVTSVSATVNPTEFVFELQSETREERAELSSVGE